MKILALAVAVILFITLAVILLLPSKKRPALSPSQSSNAGGVASKPSTPSVSSQNNQHQIYFAKITGNDNQTITTVYLANVDGTNIHQVLQVTKPVKQITPINSAFVYLTDLGMLERGRRVVISRGGSEGLVAKAYQGYVIDSYLLSPDKRYLLLWEVEDNVKPMIAQFRLVDLKADQEPKLLLREAMGEQTKYPIFWSEVTGRIYFNTYSVNRGGMHKGIFSIKPDGGDLRGEKFFAEEYSSTPVLSPDGRFAAVATYNPQASIQLPGTSKTNGIFRAAIRNPNQIRIIDLTLRQSQILMSSDELNYDLTWDAGGENLMYKLVHIDGNTPIPVQFDRINIKTKINSPFYSNPNGAFFAIVDSPNFLFAIRSQAVEGLGGQTSIYAPLVSSLYYYDTKNNSMKKILSDEPIQIIKIE